MVEGTDQLHLVFVYGTLLAKEGNHAILDGSQPLGRGQTAARYRLVDMGGYPAMVAGGQQTIHGEVYRIDDRTLTRMDDLEGHPDYYQRQRIRLDDGQAAIAYLLPLTRAQGRPVIESGDWRQRVRSNNGADPTAPLDPIENSSAPH